MSENGSNNPISKIIIKCIVHVTHWIHSSYSNYYLRRSDEKNDYPSWLWGFSSVRRSPSWFLLLHTKMTCIFEWCIYYILKWLASNTCYPHNNLWMSQHVHYSLFTPVLHMEREDPRKGQGLVSVTKQEGHRAWTGTQDCLLLSEPDGKSQESAATFLAKIPLHLCTEHTAEMS